MEYIDDVQCFLCSSSAPFFVGGRFCSLTSFFSAGALNWIHTIFRILLQSHLHRALHLFSSSVAMSVLCTRGSECVIMRIPLNWSSRILCYRYLFAEKCESKNHIPIEIDSWNAWNTHTREEIERNRYQTNVGKIVGFCYAETKFFEQCRIWSEKINKYKREKWNVGIPTFVCTERLCVYTAYNGLYCWNSMDCDGWLSRNLVCVYALSHRNISLPFHLLCATFHLLGGFRALFTVAAEEWNLYKSIEYDYYIL